LLTKGILFVAVLVSACGGASYDGTELRDGAIRYRARAPGGGWDRVDVDGQNDLAWRNPSLGAVIQVNSQPSSHRLHGA
jgi:hypothetical protein